MPVTSYGAGIPHIVSSAGGGHEANNGHDAGSDGHDQSALTDGAATAEVGSPNGGDAVHAAPASGETPNVSA